MNPQLDSLIDGKIKPLISGAMQKHLGISVADIEADITDQLKRSTLLDFSVDISMPYKKAKKAFKRAYLLRLLQQHLGNISTAASIAGIDRRSIHRLVGSLKVPAAKIRDSAQPAYVRQNAVQEIVEDVLEHYKPALNQSKYKALSAHSEALSGDIAKELPEAHLSLKEAENAFECEYFKELISQSATITQAAKKAELRYEVVHRKLKSLGLKQ